MDLGTKYLGLTLANPVVAAASPATGEINRLKGLEEAGVAAVVLPSLFEEQIEHEAMALHHGLDYGSDSFPEVMGGYFPEMDDYNTGPGEYLNLVNAAKTELTIPVIGSLNGVSSGGWTMYAKILEDAGVDALELNIYSVAADPGQDSGSVENRYLELVEQVRSKVEIPVAVKIGPYFSALTSFARRLESAGANALVLFNRFYQPDIDLKTLSVDPSLHLSTSVEMRLVLRWIAILRDKVTCDLAATTGVHTAEDVVKLILAGTDVAMMASAILANGPSRVTSVLEGVNGWLEANGYESVDQARGSVSQENAPDPSEYERGNYMKTLISFSSDWAAGDR